MPETKAQKATVARVMHEWKHGELKGSDGEPIRDRKQAVAVALSEAGDSDQVSPEQNRRNLRRTKREERAAATGRDAAEGGGRTRAQLYAEAKAQGVQGRSRMTKAQLEHALKG